MSWLDEKFKSNDINNESQSEDAHLEDIEKKEMNESTEGEKVLEKSESEKFNAPSTEIIPQVNDNALTFQVARKLKEIDSFYKEGILSYKEQIHEYNIRIERFNSKIKIIKKSCQKEEKIILDFEDNIKFTLKSLETFHHKFVEKIKSIEELEDEYKLSLDEHIYKGMLTRKTKELYALLDEIEDAELSLLNFELQKMNVQAILEPKHNEIEILENEIKEIEFQKKYFEGSALEKISQFQIEKTDKRELDTIVDTTVLDED